MYVAKFGDPELKILNVNTVVVSGGRERLFWRPLLGTWNPSMGALWTKSIRWWRNCDGSVTLSHCLLLYVSSAKVSQKYIVKDFMVEKACKDFFLYRGLETGIQRRFFWFCISGFCVLIIYSQESTRRREGLLRKCIYVRL